jgi:hypothetical protein
MTGLHPLKRLCPERHRLGIGTHTLSIARECGHTSCKCGEYNRKAHARARAHNVTNALHSAAQATRFNDCQRGGVGSAPKRGTNPPSSTPPNTILPLHKLLPMGHGAKVQRPPPSQPAGLAPPDVTQTAPVSSAGSGSMRGRRRRES